MELFHIFSAIIAISAFFAYFNYRFLKLPNSIGLMLISLVFSLAILTAGSYIPELKTNLELQLNNLNFSDLLLEGMLSFMLFAGAIHVKYEDLKSEKLSIILFSTLSVLISTFLVGFAAFYVMNAFGLQVTLISSLLFGALISPTDPIAVLSILKKAGIAKSLETKIAGESLFNDGVAVVVFITILQLANSGAPIHPGNVLLLFSQEALGGLLLGALVGFSVYQLLASIDNYSVEVLLTLAAVMGGYTVAHYVHVSGPLAMVAAGIIIGNQGKKFGMSETTAEYVDKFWELLDEIFNAMLFVLIGLELVVIHTETKLLLLSGVFVLLVLLARYISVLIPTLFIRMKEKLSHRTVMIMTWGGLRGGISIALALSIPADLNREFWVTITYVIVCFSILVQGLTVGKMAKAK